MSKQSWKPGNMLYPLPSVIVTCGETEEEYNGLTIAWTGTVCTNPPMTYISVRPSRHSYNLIKKQGGFVINLTTEEITFATDYCGVRSGKKEDKLSKMQLDYDIGDIIKAPLLKKSPVNIECETVEIKELGSHHMFLAKVVKVHVDEQYMDEQNKFHLDQAKPIVYSHGQYFGLGDALGKFGHSVQKKKNTKRRRSR
jgi:flavin reductase (DIM6/NTAB) family NADH-FMN oxidoreductase RutF